MTCNGCTQAFTYTVSQPDPLSASAVASATTKSKIDLTVTGGTPLYSFSWNNGTTVGSTQEDPLNLPAGTYSVTVTDAKGCTKTASATIAPDSCTLNVSADVRNLTCSGGNDGQIRLTVPCGNQTNGGNCYSSTPTEPETATNCNLTVTTNQDINISSGQKACIPATANVTVNNLNLNSGRLVIAGTANLSNVNLSNYDKIIILKTGKVKVSNVNFNSTTAEIQNYGTLDFEYNCILGKVINYGTITVNGDLNLNSNASNLTNYGTIQVNRTFNNSKVSVNYGTINVSFNFENNSGGTFTNYCTLNVLGNFLHNGASVFENYKTVTVGLVATLNGSSVTKAHPGSKLEADDLMLDNATVQNPGTNCSSLKALSHTTINGGFRASGPVYICDANGIEINNSTSQTFSGGAGINCSCSGTTTGAVYTWSTGATSPTLSNLTAGDYSVTISCNGCTKTYSYKIDSSQALSVTLITDSVKCAGGKGRITAQVRNVRGTLKYKWSTGAETSSINNVSAGTYSVTVTDLLTNCQVTRSVTLVEPASLVLSATSTKASCKTAEDGKASVSVTGGKPGTYTYMWSDGQSLSQATGLAGFTTYIVTVKDGRECIASVPVYVDAEDKLCTEVVCGGFGVKLSAVHPTCLLNSGSLTATVIAATGTTTYNWTGTTATGTQATGLNAGTYSVIATDSRGCKDTAFATISNPSGPEIAILKSKPSCTGNDNGSLQAVVNGGTRPYTYNWGAAGTSDLISGLKAGTYTLTVTDSRSCTKSLPVILEDGTVPCKPCDGIKITLAKSDVSCAGGNSGQLTATVSGTTTPYTFAWSHNTNLNNATAAGLSSNAYTVILTKDTCKISATAFINQPDSLKVITKGTDASCKTANNGSVAAIVTGGNGGNTYSWNYQNSTSSYINNLGAGIYTVTLTDSRNCTASDSKTLVANPRPCETGKCRLSVKLVAAAVKCRDDKTNIYSVVSGAAGNITYRWSNGATTANIENVIPGYYKLTVSDDSCSVSKDTTIANPSALVLSVGGKNASCKTAADGKATATVSGGNSKNYSYLWSDGQILPQATGLAGFTTYTVIVKDANDCIAIDSVHIDADNKPCEEVQCGGFGVKLSAVQPTCTPNSGSLTANVIAGTGTISYTWTGASVSGSQASGLNSGNYSVIVTDSRGCKDTAFATLSKPADPSVSVISGKPSCTGNDNGTLQAVVSGGRKPYSYNWGIAGTTETVSGLKAGTYSITVTDANSCTATVPITLEDRTKPCSVCDDINVNLTKSDVGCAGGNNGQITATVSGVTAPYSFSWSHD